MIAFLSGTVIGCFIGVALMACLQANHIHDDWSNEDEYL